MESFKQSRNSCGFQKYAASSVHRNAGCVFFLLFLAFPVSGEGDFSYSVSESKIRYIMSLSHVNSYAGTIIESFPDKQTEIGGGFHLGDFWAGYLRLPLVARRLNSGFSFSGRGYNKFGISLSADNGEKWGIAKQFLSKYGIYAEKKKDSWSSGIWRDGTGSIPEVFLAVSRFYPDGSLAKSKKKIPQSLLFHGSLSSHWENELNELDLMGAVSSGYFVHPGGLLSAFFNHGVSSRNSFSSVLTLSSPGYRNLNKGKPGDIPLSLKTKYRNGGLIVNSGIETPFPVLSDGSSFSFPGNISYRFKMERLTITPLAGTIISNGIADSTLKLTFVVKSGKDSDTIILEGNHQSDAGFTQVKGSIREKLYPFEWELKLSSDPQDYFVSDLIFSWGFRLPELRFFMKWKRTLTYFPEVISPIEFSVSGGFSW